MAPNNSCPGKGHSVKVYLSLKKSNRALFMNQRMHFTSLINQEDACIIVSFAATHHPQIKHKQRICQSCFLFHVVKGLLPFMSFLLLCLWHYGNNKPNDVWYLGTICKLYATGWYFSKDHRTSGQINQPIQYIHHVKFIW